jgi:drug/metabolite transporter (DMT)-like permease
MLQEYPIVIVFGLGILATLAVILKKNLLLSMSPSALIFYGHILEFAIIMLLFLSIGKIKGKQPKWTPQLITTLVLYASLMIFGTFGLLWLIKYKSISKFMPLMAVVSTFLTFMAGITLYKEKATARDFVAIIFMCVGIFLMNWK